jgi:hypothetical protein
VEAGITPVGLTRSTPIQGQRDRFVSQPKKAARIFAGAEMFFSILLLSCSAVLSRFPAPTGIPDNSRLERDPKSLNQKDIHTGKVL